MDVRKLMLLIGALVIAAVQNTAKNFRVKCFYAAAENGWILGKVLDSRYGNAQVFYKTLGAAGRVYFNAQPRQFLNNWLEVVFVINRN